jgi:hypothetical protein
MEGNICFCGNKQAYKVLGNLHLKLLLFRDEQTGQKQYISPEGGGRDNVN